MEAKLSAPKSFDAPMNGAPDLLLVVGEHSGDEHAAEILSKLRQEKPDLKVACLGGAKLEATGAQLLYDLTAVSIVGFVEVLKHYSFFKTLFETTLDWIEKYQPKEICFVDYPGFNLRLADALRVRGLSRKGGGEIGVSYYIGPQIWAWKAKRRFKMAELIDHLSVIFPFEVDCYADTDLAVEYVVHPFLDATYQLPFEYDANAPVLLLPGSRSEAVTRIFPILLDGFRCARKAKPQLRARVIYPSNQIKELLESILLSYADLQGNIELIEKSKSRVGASAALMSSGTMSLAVALSAIPGAIAYRMNPLSYYLGRFLIKIPFIGISNILLGRALSPEFIQGAACAKNLGNALNEACTAKSAEAAQVGAEALRLALKKDGAPEAWQWLSCILKGRSR
jgi:lipid-A-disaccharide synthase